MAGEDRENHVQDEHDFTAHAEMVALREVARRNRLRRLPPSAAARSWVAPHPQRLRHSGAAAVCQQALGVRPLPPPTRWTWLPSSGQILSPGLKRWCAARARWTSSALPYRLSMARLFQL